VKNLIISILLICIVFSCKEEIYSTIPTAPVSYKLNLNLYEADARLNAGVGTYLCITQKRLETDRLGFGGLLIVNGIGEEAVNIYAYDLACPNEASRNALVVPENISEAGSPTAITAKCPKCGAVFNIIDGYGTPQSGSKYYLRAYRVMKTMNNGEYLVAQ
jgi:nitrite reductase/ring-hydroxylating ferredoxin subunit